MVGKLFGICAVCGKWGVFLEDVYISTGPGHGKTVYVHRKCIYDVTKIDWEYQMGFSCPGPYPSTARRVGMYCKYGRPVITSIEFGHNAYGSILEEYDDGSRIGIICGHGGSAWLCYRCALLAYKNDHPDDADIENLISNYDKQQEALNKLPQRFGRSGYSAFEVVEYDKDSGHSGYSGYSGHETPEGTEDK